MSSGGLLLIPRISYFRVIDIDNTQGSLGGAHSPLLDREADLPPFSRSLDQVGDGQQVQLL